VYDGPGCYTFANGAILETTWSNNQPKANSTSKLLDAEQRRWLGSFEADTPLQAMLKPELVQ
jgi:hypothetical protein